MRGDKRGKAWAVVATYNSRTRSTSTNAKGESARKPTTKGTRLITQMREMLMMTSQVKRRSESGRITKRPQVEKQLQ